MKLEQKNSLNSGPLVVEEQASSADRIGLTIFRRPLETRQILSVSSRYDENEREFLHNNTMRDVFGTFHEACLLRRSEEGFDRTTLGERMAKDKTGISKLMKGPANWTLRTLSEFANALDMDVHVILCDRHNQHRYIDRVGVHRRIVSDLMRSMIDENPMYVARVHNFDRSANTVSLSNQLSAPVFPVQSTSAISETSADWSGGIKRSAI